jgi:hypothetical protein
MSGAILLSKVTKACPERISIGHLASNASHFQKHAEARWPLESMGLVTPSAKSAGLLTLRESRLKPAGDSQNAAPLILHHKQACNYRTNQRICALDFQTRPIRVLGRFEREGP